MEISALKSSLSRLWEMFEKSGLSPGAELRGTIGPTEDPPQELVREFEKAMEARPSATEGQREPSEAVAAGKAPLNLSPDLVSASERVTDPPHIAENDSFNWETSQREEGLRSFFRDQVTELSQLLEKAGGGQISPMELYRIQYLMGIFKVQTTGAVKVSQQAGQGFESLLKQQG